MTASFLRKDPEDLGRFLVQQARTDRAPRAALQRAMISLTSVSLGVGLTSSAKLAWGASAAGKVTPWVITKCVAIGMTATLATFIGADNLQRAFDASETSTGEPPARLDVRNGHPANPSSLTPSGPAALAEAPPASSIRTPAGAPSTSATSLEDAPPSRQPSLPSSIAFDSAVAAGDSAALTREVVQLRRARASLVASAPGAALQALDRYGHEFPAGALRAEAAALRIEAVAMVGDQTLLRSLASDFLTRFSSSPLAARVRVLSGRASDGEAKP